MARGGYPLGLIEYYTPLTFINLQIFKGVLTRPLTFHQHSGFRRVPTSHFYDLLHIFLLLPDIAAATRRINKLQCSRSAQMFEHKYMLNWLMVAGSIQF